jgi:hypothetical protein
MSTPQRLVAIAVGAIVVLIVTVLVLRAAGAPIGLGPEVSPSVTPAPSPSASPSVEPSASPSVSPSPASSAEALEVLTAIEEQVEEIRELPPAEIGPADIITREQLRQELLEEFEESYPQEERTADNVTLRAMGLLGPDEDIAELQLDLLGEGVLGFYDDREKRMVIVSDAGVDAEAKFTYAHEYTHALQDAAFPGALEIDPDEDDDVALARTALFEGDATNAMILWAIQNLSQDELLEISQTPLPDTTGIPDWLVEVTTFPYIDGLTWVQLLSGGGQDMAAIDDAFADPPVSTEQIIHFEKWLDREEPMALTDPALAAGLGDGWEEVETTTIGEAFLRIILASYGEDAGDAGAAAEGWGGDRLVVASGPDEAFALAWRLAWDSAAEAEEFAAAYARVSPGFDFPVQLVSVSDTEHLVVHASSDEILDEALAALS